MTVGQPLNLASVGPSQVVPVTGQGEIGHLQVMAQLCTGARLQAALQCVRW